MPTCSCWWNRLTCKPPANRKYGNINNLNTAHCLHTEKLPKPKVAGSNPVFRSREIPTTTDRSTSSQRSFLYYTTHPSGKPGSAKTFSSLLWRAGVDTKRRGYTRADFESEDEKSV